MNIVLAAIARAVISAAPPAIAAVPQSLSELVVAVLAVLDGTIKDKGILAPVTPELVEPIRKRLLDQYGIELKEKTVA